ncbi:MAG: hypothetical protein AAGF26_03160 [Cyanobacteria bacterium P01_G01_bin.49]
MKKQIDIYQKVLLGEILPKEAKQEIASSQIVMSENQQVQVIVTPNHVSWMLNCCLNQKINEQELSDWASFLTSDDIENIYIHPNWEDERQADYYESMWYILQQLSPPAIDGKITRERVREHLEILDRSYNNLSSG